jgi:BioD-like phosphotransacetylase family protein
MKDGTDGFLVHISRRNPDSGHDVLFTLNTDAVLNAVFAALAKASEGEEAPESESETRSVEVNGVTATGLKAAMKDAVQA